jgi:hypothetical protein
MLKKLMILIVAAFFLLTITPMTFAADQWAVIQDTSGKCSVRSVKGKTPKTIAGPFATKAEAEKAKQEKCGKPDQKKK